MHKLTIEVPYSIYEELKIRKGRRTIKEYITSLLEREFEAHSIKALILCGGKSANLKPLTSSVPKPLIPVGYKPILEYQLALLSKYGFDNVVLLIGHLGERIIRYVSQHPPANVNVSFVSESTPLDTAGAIANARHHVRSTFLVLNGDIITNINISNLLEEHQQNAATVTFAVVKLRRDANRSFGVVSLDSSNNILSYEDKPGPHKKGTLVNAGLYVMSSEVFRHIPEGKPMSISKDLFPKLLERGELAAFPVPDNTYWQEVSHIESYADAWEDYFSGKLII